MDEDTAGCGCALGIVVAIFLFLACVGTHSTSPEEKAERLWRVSALNNGLRKTGRSTNGAGRKTCGKCVLIKQKPKNQNDYLSHNWRKRRLVQLPGV